MARLSLENKASHAVAEASGTVLACSRKILPGNLNDIRSSAMQYWLYAPKPLTSPAEHVNNLMYQSNEDKLLTSPNQPRYNITLGVTSDITTQLDNFTDEVTSKNGSVTKSVAVKGLN